MDRMRYENMASAPLNALLQCHFRFPMLNAYVSQLSDSTGIEIDQLRYVLCLFFAYPMAIIYRNLGNPRTKHMFDIILGIASAQFVFGSSWIHSFVTSTVTYILLLLLPPSYSVKCIFCFNLMYLSASHIYRVYTRYMIWSLDYTGPQMLLVIKLTSLAYNYYDGVSDKHSVTSKVPLQTLQLRQKLAINKVPSMLEYYGYIYNFSTFFAGPAFEIREYLDVTRGDKFRNTRIPSNTFAAISKLALGIFCMGMFLHFSSQYPISNLSSEIVAQYPLFRQIFTLYMTLMIVKCKYYGAWKVAEGGAVLAHFGYDDTKKSWNGISNMDILGFELAPSIRQATRAWNKGTQNWLERYVYARTNSSLLATYFCSAFWHGFYPGYYLFFMSVPLGTAVNRLAYKRLRPLFLNSPLAKRIYDIVGTVASVLAMHYFVMPFQTMSWTDSITAWKNTYFAGHVLCILLFILLSLLPITRTKSI